MQVARDGSDIEQTDGGGQVAAGDFSALPKRADTVIETHLGIPDRVPDPVGQRGQVPLWQRPSVVQQHQVEIAERPGIAATQGPDRGQGNPLSRAAARRRLPGLRQPVAGVCRDGLPACRTGTRRGERAGAGQVESGLEQGHRD